MNTKTLLREEYLCNNTVVKYTFLIYVVLVIVQDLYLQVPFGTIARSPYIFLSPLIFIFITFISYKLYLFKGVSYYLSYYIYSVLVTTFLVLYYIGFRNHGMDVYGENLIYKCVKNSMYNLILIFTLYNFYFIFRYSGLRFIEKILTVLIVVQVLIGYIQLVVPDAFNYIKTPSYSNTGRLSLLNTEPSHTFPQLVLSILCYLCIRYYNHKRLKAIDYFIAFAGFILLMFIQSRGGTVVMFFCFVLFILFTKQSFRTRLLLLSASIAFVVPTLWIIVNVIIPELAYDIDKFSSVSTRLITIISSVVSLFVYPLGQGYGTYLITFPGLLDATIYKVLLISPIRLSTWELDRMITTGRALTVKSGLLNEILYTGWAIVIFYIFFFSNAYKKLRNFRNLKTVKLFFQYILIFVIVNYLFVSSIETSYVIFLPFALLERFSKEATYSGQGISAA